MEKENNKFIDFLKKDFSIILFYIALSIEIIILLIDKSVFINPIEGRLFQITFVLFCIKILFTKYTKTEWLVILVMGILAMISYQITGRNELIRIVAFLGACKGISMQKVLKYLFFTTFIGILLLVIASLIGLFGDVAMIADYGRGGIETRYTLGIGHPNALHCMFWAIMTLGIYLYHERLEWYHYMVLFVINILLYQLTISKAGVLISIFTLGFSMVIRYCYGKVFGNSIQIFSYFVLFFSVFFSVTASISGTDPLVYQGIDKMLTNRLMLARALGGTDTWSLFSSPQNTEYFDMGFVRVIYWYGLIPAIIIVVLLVIMITRLMKEKDYWALMLVLSFVIYTVVEAHAVSVYIARNYVLFLFGSIWVRLLKKDSSTGYLQQEAYLWEITACDK